MGLVVAAGPVALAAQELGSGSLAIAGARLTVSPESQTVPFDTPTIVNTTLVGYDASAGALPPDLRVVASFVGPEIDGVIELETLPNEPFRIPRLSLRGEYRLEDIRLVQGDQILEYAEPRDAAITVTQILVTRVSSRPLSIDEIRQNGIVVDNSRIRGFNLSFGFAVAGEVFDYNVPIYYIYIPGPRGPLGYNLQPPAPPVTSRFAPPRLAPFRLEVSRTADSLPTNGCVDNCYEDDPPPLPGVLFFPTDITLLNQFFSVVLMATNGAPEGDALVIRDLTARMQLPSGLRLAETEPPTSLGTPVPMRVPGPDGELGTADDLNLLVGQATAKAEWLAEGLREGTHVVDFALEGVLEGMPNGIRRLSGTARGAVVVRDPTLGVTITHPDVVATDEEYSLFLTVSNTSNSPANLVTLELDLAGLAGVDPIGPTSQTIDSIPPGESELIEFRLRSRLTGRVVASAVRASGHVSPRFQLTTTVGDGSIPLSPISIILPKEARSLPDPVFRHALGMVGLGFSLASAPPSLHSDLPRLGQESIHARVFELAQAGRYLSLGEAPVEALALLAAEWLGARDRDWEWDALRLRTVRGGRLADAIGALIADPGSASPDDHFDRIIANLADLPPLAAAYVHGGAASIRLISRTTGRELSNVGGALRRELPFAELFRGTESALALATVPEAAGYRLELAGGSSGSTELHVAWPTASGELRALRWESLSLGASGAASLDLSSPDGPFVLAVDADGDGSFEALVPADEAPIEPRPFDVLGAVQNVEVDKTGHLVDVLFSRDVDLDELGDPGQFVLPDKVSNGGSWIRGEGAFDELSLFSSRVVRVVFNNPLSPYSVHRILVDDVFGAAGERVVGQEVEVETRISMPGTLVEGRVIGAEGDPIPYARVELWEYDWSNVPYLDNPCVKHRTAAVRAGSDGRFLFDYVRETECGGLFELRGAVPETTETASAFGRVRFIGQTVNLDIVLTGRGTVRGTVRYEDGTIPEELEIVIHHPVRLEGYHPTSDEFGNFESRGIPVGPIAILAHDRNGNFATVSGEVPFAGATVVRDVTIVRQPERPRGELRGRVFAPDGATPVSNAYVALYVDAAFTGVLRSGLDGGFDFGEVPAGTAELEAFEGETGRSGARLYFELLPDRVNQVDVLLVDERGSVSGRVFRRDPVSGASTPVEGAVVYLNGQPFHDETDAYGAFHLAEALAASTQLVAVDVSTGERVSAPLELSGEGFAVVRDLYFQGSLDGGRIAGEVRDTNGNLVHGAIVHIATGDTTWSYETTTGADGRFLFAQTFEPGNYSVHAMRGSDGARQSVTIQHPGATAFASLQFARGTLRGQVRVEQPESDPTPVIALVRYWTTVVRHGVLGRDITTHDIETDGDGRWEIPDVLAGPYEVEIFNAFYGERVFRGSILLHGETHDLDVLYGQSGTVEGTIVDHDGVTPAAGATVRLRHPAFSNFEVTSDSAGRFLFEGIPPDPGVSFALEATYQNGAIFRQGRVYAVVSRSGERVEPRIVLPKQGTVRGHVEISAGTPAVGAFVTLTGSEFPNQRMTAQTSSTGDFEFRNVLAGTISIGVRDLSSLGARAAAELTEEGETVHFLLQLEQVGSISGSLRNPDGGGPAAFAQVRLLRGGLLFDAVTADADGLFEFTTLPLATYSVAALEAASGRSGRRDGLGVLYDGHVVTAEIVLEARGRVLGQVRDGADQAAVPNAIVRLSSQGIVRYETFVTTGVDGRYEFGGVAQGPFVVDVTDPVTARRAIDDGEILVEDEVVELDLVLAPLGSVSGRVLASNGVDLFTGAVSVLVEQDRIQIGASLSNPYAVEGLRSGRFFAVSVSEPGGAHRGFADMILPAGATEAITDVRMWAIGSVRARVVDALGVPVAGAQVGLRGHTAYGYYSSSATTGADGSALFAGVGEGNLSLDALDPATLLRGSRGLRVDQDGVELALDVALQPYAGIRATILHADGVTPASGSIAVASRAGSLHYAQAGSTGEVLFTSLPLGTYAVSFFGPAASGEWHESATLSTLHEVVDLGAIVLDTEPPRVVGVEPLPNAIGVPLGAVVRVRFSEPLDPARSNPTSALHLARVGGGSVALVAPHVYEDGNRALRATPAASLASFTSYRFSVGSGLLDVAGRPLAAAFQSTFTTADVRPPVIVETFPVAGALNVPVAVQIRALFDEAVVRESLSGSALQLTDLDTGQTLGTTFALLPGDRDLRINPVGDLVADHRHEVRIQGVRDLAGNVTPDFVWAFEATDVTPPAIGATTPGSGTVVVSGSSLTISADVVENQAMGTVRFRFLGLDVPGTRIGTGTIWQATVTVPPVEAATSAPVEVEATDAAGLAANAMFNLQVEPLLDPDRPVVSILCPSDGAMLAPGTGIDVSVEATDPQGLLRVEFFLGADTIPASTLTAPPYVYRLVAPASAADGEVLLVRAVATDFGLKTGQATVEARVVAGAVFTSDFTLTPSNPTYEHETVVVAGGTFTLLGAHAFERLVVLAPGRVTHMSTVAGAEFAIDLSLDDALYVGCGAAIDVTGRGYDGGTTPGGRGFGYGNSTAEGAYYAGSLAGRGGLFDFSGPVYGSPFDPRESGAGGGDQPNITGGEQNAGGGRVDIRAAGEVRIDGAIVADGVGFDGVYGLPSGSGGSIRLEAAAIEGLGRMSASGPLGGRWGGGGGRIALFGEVDPGLLSRAVAAGGPLSTSWELGGAGTIFVRGPGDLHGELIVDNEGRGRPWYPRDSWTELLGLGTGTIETVGVDSITDLEADFRHGVSGLWLVAGDDPDRAWRVVGNEHHGDTLQLDVSSRPLDIVPGESYRGEVRLDRLTVRGKGRLLSTDPIVTAQAPSIEAGSELIVGDLQPPSIVATWTPAGQVGAGQSLALHIELVDDGGLLDVSYAVTGAVTETVYVHQHGKAVAALDDSFTLPLDPAADYVRAEVRARDLFGRTTEVVLSIPVVEDSVPPTIAPSSPTPGAAFVGGNNFFARANVTDAAGIELVRISFAGVTRVVPWNWMTPSQYSTQFTVPVVDVDTSLEVVFEATDRNGNVSTVSVPVLVRPPLSPEGPTLAILCPSGNAPTVPGASQTLRVAASDPEGVSRVEFYAPGASTPFSTDSVAPYEATVTVPGNQPVGTDYVVRVRALDPASHANEQLVRYSVRAGTRITGSLTISATDLSFEDRVLAVEGTATVIGPHRFAALLVLSGSVIPLSVAAGVEPSPLDLEITGDLYVGCGGSVRADSRGYAPGRTYALEALPGTAGGVHGGRAHGGAGLAYGSPIVPVASGSGGEGTTGTNGGGAIRISTQSGAVIDGNVVSSGGTSSHSAGGSILLEAASLAGAGRIEALGGLRSGGGRIALVADTISEDLLTRTSARGGLSTVGTPGGGAGTLFVKDAASTYGTLIVDNGGSVTNSTTELVPIGTGVVESADGAGFTAVAAEFRHSLAGGWVAVDGDFENPRQIAGNPHRGRTLTLEPTADGPNPLPGSTYEGFWRFDHLIVRGQGHLLLRDPVLTTEAPVVAPGSTLTVPQASGAPSASIQVDRGSTVLPNQSFQVLLLGADLGGVAELRVTLSGRIVESLTFPGGGQVLASATISRVMPIDPQVGHVEIHLEVTNLAGVTTVRDFTIDVPADTEPPVVSISAPEAETSVAAGTLVSIAATASDNVGLRPTTVRFGAISVTDSTPPSITASLYAPPVPAPTSIPIEVRAEDFDRNITTTTRAVLVTPSADTTPPVFTSLCPAEETMARPGESVRITANWSDNVRLYAVESYVGAVQSTFAAGSPNGSVQLNVTVPADAPEDSEISVRVRLLDFGGNSTERMVTVRVRSGLVVSSSVTIAGGDLNYEDQTIYVAPTGRLTVEGPHRFRDLVLQNGALLNHPASVGGSVERLQISLTDSLYVGCTASVDVTGRGYPGTPSATCSSPAFTFPGTTIGGAVGNQGGSHGGVGGNVLGRAEFGSLFSPDEAGGGGGCLSGNAGGPGGGVVRIEAAGSVEIDGSIRADGSYGGRGGGAGGSVWISGARVGGAGLVSVRGGSSSTGLSTQAACGGGGRAAIYAASLDRALVDRADASSSNSCPRRGAAGTVYVRLDDQPLGELIVDARGMSTTATYLPGIGSGTVDAVVADAFTDNEASFRWSVVGHEVAFGEDLESLWEVVEHEHLGQSLTLDVSAAALAAEAGDLYRGVLWLDRVVLRGQAQVVANDIVRTVSPVEIGAGSNLSTANEAPPTLDPSRISIEQGLYGAEVVGTAGAVSDLNAPVNIWVRNPTTGQQWTGAAAGDGSFRVYVAGFDGAILEILASDSGTPPLTSEAIALEPFADGIGLRPQLSGPATIAFDGPIAVQFACGASTLEIGTVDLSDPTSPQQLLSFSATQNVGDRCNAGRLACTSGCEDAPRYYNCWEGCETNCAPGDDACMTACDDACWYASREHCEGACIDAEDACDDDGCASGSIACAAVCSEALSTVCADSCTAGSAACSTYIPELGYGAGSCGPADYADGLLAFAQGPYLRVVDLSDPSQLGYESPAQTLGLFGDGGGEIAALSIDGSQIHAVEESSPARHFVVDAHNRRAPRSIQQSTLQVGGWVADLEVKEGELRALYWPSSGTQYQHWDVGDPARPLSFGTTTAVGANPRISIIEDLALFPSTSMEIASKHRDDSSTAVTFSTAGCSMKSGVELGDFFLTDCGAVGTARPDRPDHGFTLAGVYPAPPGSLWNLSPLDVGAGFVWLNGTGFASNALRPWLADRSISAESTLDGGARVRGVAGAAGPEAVAVRVQRADGTVIETGVEADGSFDLDVPNVAIGERLTIQALDLAQQGGRRIRIRNPIGASSGWLELEGGAARVAVSNDLLAAVPAVQPPSGPVEVPIARLEEDGAVDLARVTVDGPVTDVVIQSDVLYVAGQRLYVFDLTDPTTPLAAPPVDLFAGQRLLGLVATNGYLRALGATATAQRLKTVSLTAPFAPVEVAGTHVDLSAVTRARLGLVGGALYRFGNGRIERWNVPVGSMPTLAASRTGSGDFVDLELAGGQLHAAIAGTGLRQVTETGSSISLGPAPARSETAVAGAAIPDGGTERLFRVAGLGGLKRDGPQELLQVASRCFLRDVHRLPDDRLLMLTDCGIELREVSQ